MSPSDPPVGLPVDIVLAPYAFCDDVPNVVACTLLPDIFNPGSSVQATTFGTSSQNAYGARTISTGNPTGGNDGDIWYKY